MLRWVANLSMLFTEVPFIERFERAARSGFRYVEYLFPYDEDVPAIERELGRLDMKQVLFNLPAGRWGQGERGIAVDPRRREEFRDGVRRAVEIARRLGVPQLNCLVGIADPGVPEPERRAILVDNLRYAADRLAEAGLTLLVEPINTFDMPGFYLSTSGQALAVMDEVNRPNLKLQYDVYHMQRMEGNLVATIRALSARIGHVQVADSPDRHQPGTGEIRFPFVLHTLESTGYGGYVSLEYKPLGATEESLAEAARAGLDAFGFPRPGAAN